eukprot:gene20289-26337_t
MNNTSDIASDTVIVNYLPYDTNESELKVIFQRHGVVELTTIIKDKKTLLPLGYGFIKYSNVAEASLAISELNGFVLRNKSLKVGYALSSNSKKYAKVYVTSLPEHFTENDTYEFFKQFGPIVECRMPAKSTDRKGFAFIIFENEESAKLALSLNDKENTCDKVAKVKVQLIDKSSNNKKRIVANKFLQKSRNDILMGARDADLTISANVPQIITYNQNEIEPEILGYPYPHPSYPLSPTMTYPLMYSPVSVADSSVICHPIVTSNYNYYPGGYNGVVYNNYNIPNQYSGKTYPLLLNNPSHELLNHILANTPVLSVNYMLPSGDYNQGYGLNQ